jgi:hypothetical protein
MRHYIDPHEKAWVETLPDYVIVSWPGGHRRLSYDDPVVTLIDLIRSAVTDLWEVKPDAKELKAAKQDAYANGYHEGWTDRTADYTRRQAEAEDHPSSGRRRAVRTVNTGTKL